MRTVPEDTMPGFEAGLVGGRAWRLAEEHPSKLALLAFYRGVHCPICRRWLGELERLVPRFTEHGVSVIALSCDTREAPPEYALRVVVPVWRRPWIVLGGRTFAGDLLADLETVEMHAAGNAYGSIGRLIVEAQTSLKSIELDVLDRDRPVGDLHVTRRRPRRRIR